MDQKFRFKLNLFDGIVLALALCVAMFLAYTALKPASPAVQEPGAVPAASTVRYTIRFQRMLEGTGELVQPGDALVDNIKNYDLGTVVSTEIKPAVTQVVDQVSRRKVLAEMPGYEEVYVVVESDCTRASDGSVTLDGGYKLQVNNTAYIKGAGYMASGPITDMEWEGQA